MVLTQILLFFFFWFSDVTISSKDNLIRPPKSEIFLSKSTSGVIGISPSSIDNSSQYVTVTWSNIASPLENDYLALFNESNYLQMSPIKFRYVPTPVLSYGTMQFRIINRRTNYRFAYCRNTEQNGTTIIEYLLVSDVLYYHNQYIPMNVHIGLLPWLNNSINILWTQKDVYEPQIQYGTNQYNLNNIINVYNYTKCDRNNLCDINESLPAGNDGYFDLGYVLSGILNNLSPNGFYFYRVGDSKYGWSSIYNFTSPPINGKLNDKTNKVSLITYGDLGITQIDYSDDVHNEEVHSINTTTIISKYYINNNNNNKIDLLLHIGDISYARGYLSDWDVYFNQIGSIASYIPYLTAIGNHEYGWSGEWTPPSIYGKSYGNTDSGGECGIVYNLYYPFSSHNYLSLPNQDYEPWYYIDYGIVRIIVMSTEHDFSIGSPQNNYIVNTLINTDRQIFPWVVLAGHRAMYPPTNNTNDQNFGIYFREQLEDVLFEYKVPIALWGHHHNYARSCPVYKEQCNNNGAVHMIIGMSGIDLNGDNIFPSPMWPWYKFFSNKIYGFQYFEFLNHTHAQGKFIQSDDNQTIIDDFYVVNTYH